MAELIWSLGAQRDFYAIVDYIAADNPTAAIEVSNAIQASAEYLRQFPRQGRPGRVTGTRELVVSRARYMLIYTLENDKITIAQVRHQAQLWPPMVKQDKDEEP